MRRIEMFIFKRIKKLEEDVSELKAENEKLHRIIKHAGSEPVVCIKSHTTIHKILDPYNASLYYRHTLYYYKDNTEYSVDLDNINNSFENFRKIEILKDIGGIVYFICLAERIDLNSNGFIGLYSSTIRCVVAFDYVCKTYEIHKIDDDIIKVYKDLEILNEEKEETNNQ